MGMFWNDVTSIEPLRQHRWILSNGAGVWVWAKSVKLPQFAVETQKYQIGNHKLNYPGLLEWQLGMKISQILNNYLKEWGRVVTTSKEKKME